MNLVILCIFVPAFALGMSMLQTKMTKGVWWDRKGSDAE